MPLLKTYWHQKYPYNELIGMRDSGTSEDGETRKPAGCVAIAVAQILNYYCYPNIIRHPIFNLQVSIDWTKTQEKSISVPNDEIAKLVWMVNRGVFTENKDNGSSSNIDKAQSFLKLNGYGAYIHSGPEVDWIMRDEIIQGRPVYVSGHPATGSGHAWVCDGYYSNSAYYKILAYKLTSTVLQHFLQNPYSKYQEDTREYRSNEFLHMNWGWKEWWTIDENDPSTLQNETYGWYRSVFNNQPGYGDIRIIQIIKK